MTTQCIGTDYHCANSTSPERAKAESVMQRLFKRWSKRRQHKLDRLALKELSSLDDAILRDLGVSRGDVVWASRLPSSVDAAAELEIIARRRSS